MLDERFFDDLDFDSYAPEKGRVLISEPFLPDPNFSRSVVLLTEAAEEGAMGFVLNRKTELKLGDVIAELENTDFNLFTGGPVGLNELFFLHTLGEQLEGSIRIKDELFWGGNYEQLKALLLSGDIANNQIRFFTGYSGWAPRQLEAEINQKSWIVSPLDTEVIMQDTEDFWKKSMKNLGKKFEVMSSFPRDPGLN